MFIGRGGEDTQMNIIYIERERETFLLIDIGDLQYISILTLSHYEERGEGIFNGIEC